MELLVRLIDLLTVAPVVVPWLMAVDQKLLEMYRYRAPVFPNHQTDPGELEGLY
jgi:hypothetical protein